MLCKIIFFCYVFGVFIFTFSNSARILAITNVPSYSHQSTYRPLWRELSLRGHQITLITTDPMHDRTLTNLREIDVHFSYGLMNLINKEYNMNPNISLVDEKKLTISSFANITDLQLQHPQIKMLIHNKYEHFDLVMAGYLFPHTMLAFAERFKCPYIGMVSQDPLAVSYDGIGNPTHPILYPDFMFGFSDKLTFWERLKSVFSYIYIKLVAVQEFAEAHNLLVEKHFGKGYPTVQEVFNNVSMLFVYTNHIIHPIRPLIPTIIEIGGGSHMKSSQSLSKELEEILNDALQGFIYFSMGTVVKCKDLPEHTINILLETFAELPYRIVWKLEDEVENKPDNVFTFKWIPQQSILYHKNIKLFITHGGLHSIEESIHAGVPMIGMPVVRDQIGNVKWIESKGLGLQVDYNNLDKNALKDAVLEVINNPRYTENVKASSEIMKDQPMSGLEKAVWWTEYILRHKGAKHLRSPALDLPAYQYYLLDVIGFCVGVIVVVTVLIILVIRLAIKLFRVILNKSKVKKD